MSRLVPVVCLVACMSLIPELGLAKEPQREAPPAGAQATPAPGGATTAPCVRPRDLVSQEEMAAHRVKMRSLQTPEERQALQKEWRAELEARAAKRGQPLCSPPQGGGRGPGMGMGRGRMGPGGPPPAEGAAPPAGATTPKPEAPAPTPPADGGAAPPQ